MWNETTNLFPHRFPTNTEQAKKWLENIRLHNQKPVYGANGLICCEHFQNHDFHMRKGQIFKLVPGAIPSVFVELEENIQIVETSETSLSPELPELTELTESQGCVYEDDEEDENGKVAKALHRANLIISKHRRRTDKSRYMKKRVNRLRATANQLSKSILEMRKKQKKDAELLKALEVCRINQQNYSF